MDRSVPPQLLVPSPSVASRSRPAPALSEALAKVDLDSGSDVRRAHVAALERLWTWLAGRVLGDETLAAYIAVLGEASDSPVSAFRLLAAIRVRERLLHDGYVGVVGPASIAACRRLCGEDAVSRAADLRILDSACWDAVVPVLRDSVLYRGGAVGPAGTTVLAHLRGCRDAVLLGLCCFVGITRGLMVRLRWDGVVESPDHRLIVRWPFPSPFVRKLSIEVIPSVELHIRDLRELVRPAPSDLVVPGHPSTISRRLRAAAEAGGLPFNPRPGHLIFARFPMSPGAS